MPSPAVHPRRRLIGNLARFKLTIEYDGSPFDGWQRLGEDRPTVQRALEEALERIVGEPVQVFGAGRTDAGVHALGQIAHIDLPKVMTPFKLSEALNAHLRPDPVAIVKAETVDETFHARFSATKRIYWYALINRRADLTLTRGRAWRIGRALDAEAMHAAAQRLVGRHDFTTFRDVQCQATSPVRTLEQLTVTRRGDAIDIWVAARSFLHRQVRSMVGSLVEVGSGKWTPDTMTEVLNAKERSACGPVAPPDGLYLAEVRYDAVTNEDAQPE